MKVALRFSGPSLLLLLLLGLFQSPCLAQTDSSLTVLGFSWSQWHRPLSADIDWETAPSTARPPISDEDRKIIERRYGDKMRSDELRKVERDAVKSSLKPGQAYMYKVKVQNASAKTIRVFYWEYQVKETADPENLTRRQFVCAVKVKTNGRKEIEAISAAPPANIISAKTLGSNSPKPFDEKAIINRIEYEDGSIWQRDGWNIPQTRSAFALDVQESGVRDACWGL